MLPTTNYNNNKINNAANSTTHSQGSPIKVRIQYQFTTSHSVCIQETGRSLGLLDLYTEQGACQIKMLISHLRARSYLQNTILILLESYQISAGQLGNSLVNLTTNTYAKAPWIQSIRSFLSTIRGTIEIPKLRTLKKLGMHDQAIMENANQSPYTPSELEAINACRLFLQVTTLAEITEADGETLLPSAIHGNLDITGRPELWKTSYSLLQWPNQDPPPRKAWTLWKRYIYSHTNQQRKLSKNLGDWLNNCQDH
jgi:hypothetical protein